MPKRLAPLNKPLLLMPARIVLLGMLAAMSCPGIARGEMDSLASQVPYQTPRILILDPVVRGGDPKEARAFAGWLTTALRKDGRTVPFRPTAATRSDTSLAVFCGDTTCAKGWRQKMTLDQIWFGSMEWTGDSVRVEIRALDAKDAVVEGAGTSGINGHWQAQTAAAMVEKLLKGVPWRRSIVLDMKAVGKKPRILVLDLVAPHGDSMEGRKFSGLLATQLRKDGRTIPFRPTPASPSDSSLAVSCGAASCAKGWFHAMPLEQVWFGSLEKDADSVRLRIQALGTQDSVIALEDHRGAGSLTDRGWQFTASEEVVEKFLSNMPAKKDLLLDGTADKDLLAEAFAQQIAVKEKQYNSRIAGGSMIAAIGAGTVVMGLAVKALTTIPCADFDLDLGLSGAGTEGMSPEESRRYEQAKAEEKARKMAEKNACLESSPGIPMVIVGCTALIGGLVTLATAGALSGELRDLKNLAAASGVAVSPYIQPASGSPGLFAQVRF